LLSIHIITYLFFERQTIFTMHKLHQIA